MPHPTPLKLNIGLFNHRNEASRSPLPKHFALNASSSRDLHLTSPCLAAQPGLQASLSALRHLGPQSGLVVGHLVDCAKVARPAFGVAHLLGSVADPHGVHNCHGKMEGLRGRMVEVGIGRSPGRGRGRVRGMEGGSGAAGAGSGSICSPWLWVVF